MAHYQNKTIDIILPWRIGDALLNIPMLVCLKQLNQKYNDNNKIRIIAQPFLTKLYSPLDIFECKALTVSRKIISNIKPADIAFFTETITGNWGYKAKTSYGLTNPSKKIINYAHEMLFMNLDKLKDLLPAEIISFLQDKYQISLYSISLFGIILELGYTTEQIIDTFDLNFDCLALNNFQGFNHPVMNENHIVFCMEAAYGKKGDANRRWDENYYIDIANKCYENFNLKAVFVGINQDFKLPDKPNFIDLRKQVNLFELAQVIKSSVGYIGNDTAPLHITNVMQKPSVGVYFMKHSLVEFSPIFPLLNTQVFCPEKSEQVYEIFNNYYKKSLNKIKSECLINKNSEIKKIAIVFGAKIGDVVNVQPVCRLLKEQYPNSELVFVTWPGAVEIAGLLPEVNFVEIFDNKGKGKNPFLFLKDALSIKFKHKIDLAVVVNDSFTYNLLSFLIGAKYRVGRHCLGPNFLLHKKYPLTRDDLEELHVIPSYLKALEPLELYTDDYSLELKTNFETIDRDYINNLIKDSGYSNYKLIGFSPCSALEFKDWSIEEGKRFIDLINQLPDYKVVLTGDYVARDFAAKIREMGTNDFLDLTCKTNIKQFMILLSKFYKFVSVDTGSAHLAYVLNIPTVVLFFNELFKRWGPQDLSLHKVIYNPDRFALKAEEVLKELNLSESECVNLNV